MLCYIVILLCYIVVYNIIICYSIYYSRDLSDDAVRRRNHQGGPRHDQQVYLRGGNMSQIYIYIYIYICLITL